MIAPPATGLTPPDPALACARALRRAPGPGRARRRRPRRGADGPRPRAALDAAPAARGPALVRRGGPRPPRRRAAPADLDAAPGRRGPRELRPRGAPRGRALRVLVLAGHDLDLAVDAGRG